MRYLIPILLALALASCTTLRRAGEWVCERSEIIQGGASQVGGFFGTPGSLIAGAFNLILDAGCDALGIVTSIPADAATDVGLMEAEVEAPAATGSVPDGQ